MRRPMALFFCASALLMAQDPNLDEGRLDPAWFGAPAVFQPSKALGFQWLKPGLDLRRRTLRLKTWEPAAWLVGKRAAKDQDFLTRVQGRLEPNLAAGIQRGLKGTLPVSSTLGDVVLVGRVVDAIGESEDYLATGHLYLSFDLKLVDGDTGELLGAFHDTLRGPSVDSIPLQFGKWSEDLGRLLASLAAPPAAAKPAQAPPPPAYDLEGALRRIDALKRDGLISEDEWKSLRQKATEKAK